VFGRNVWQRPRSESLAFVAAVRKILARYPTKVRANTRRRTSGDA
jgi:DhnA family fructose-bisphosphate aldolase class Ia